MTLSRWCHWSTVVIALLAARLGGQTLLVDYTFEGSTNNPAIVALHLSAGPLVSNGMQYLGPASLGTPIEGAYGGWWRAYQSGVQTDAASATDWAGAIAAADYASMSITVDPGYTLSLSSITFYAGISGFGGITAGYGVYSNVTGFSGSPLGGGSLTQGGPTWINLSTNLSANPTFQGLGAGTYEFRIYFTDDYFGTTTFQNAYLDDIRFNGTLAAVPEPSAYVMLAGLMALGWVASRRKIPVLRPGN